MTTLPDHTTSTAGLRIMLQFEHSACDGVIVDVHLPLPDPITSAGALAARVCPACPICKQPMRYVGFDLADTEKP